ncbi:MAG: hypothetical protein NTY38_00040, partial [Acidobacteria bacterium]|nr:hypothetical protein [Acidobacteriota bacterium]
IGFSALSGGGGNTRGMSGGEWALVVLVILFGGALHAGMGVARHWSGFGPIRINGMKWLGQPFDYPIPAQRQAVSKTARIVIENLRGNVRIAGADTDTVTVSGRKTIRTFQQSDADLADRQTPLEFTVQGDRVILRTNQERTTGDREITEDLDITVPRTVSLEGRGRYGDFEINDINGEVDVDSENAGVRLQNIGGRVRIDTRRSDIIRVSNAAAAVEVKGRGEDVELENIKGQVTVNGSYSGDLQFRNIEKPVRFDSPQTQMEIARIPGTAHMSLSDFNANDAVGFKMITKQGRAP